MDWIIFIVETLTLNMCGIVKVKDEEGDWMDFRKLLPLFP